MLVIMPLSYVNRRHIQKFVTAILQKIQENLMISKDSFAWFYPALLLRCFYLMSSQDAIFKIQIPTAINPLLIHAERIDVSLDPSWTTPACCDLFLCHSCYDSPVEYGITNLRF